jgi:hypothetical protein
MAGMKGSSELGRSAEPARVAGIAPWHEPAGKRRRASASNRDPTGSRRGLGREGGPGKRQGLRAAPRSEGRPEGPWPRCEPGDGAASAGPDPPGKRRWGFGPDTATRRGSARGFRASPPRPTGDRTGLRGLAAGSGESGRGVSRSAAIPKPPSERWPRHPATAVKAGTSGGRWRHRPPLRFGSKGEFGPGRETLSNLPGAVRRIGKLVTVPIFRLS